MLLFIAVFFGLGFLIGRTTVCSGNCNSAMGCHAGKQGKHMMFFSEEGASTWVDDEDGKIEVSVTVDTVEGEGGAKVMVKKKIIKSKDGERETVEEIKKSLD